MIVKIGKKVYSAEDEPIMLILTDREKNLIAKMGPQVRFCIYPEKEFSPNDIKEFMKLEGE